MSLTARPKRPVHYKKRQAGHHRQGKHYVKAYLPYLPLLSLLVLMLMISSLWSRQQMLGSAAALSVGTSASVASTWNLVTLIVVVLAAAILLVHNGFRVQRMLSKGEAFIAHHPWLDAIVLVLAGGAYIVGRTAVLVH